MKENIEKSQGLPMAEAVMTKLVEKGMGRGDAHEIVRKSSIIAYNKNLGLKDILLEDKKVSKLIEEAELGKVMKPENYLGATDKIVDNIVKKLSR